MSGAPRLRAAVVVPTHGRAARALPVLQAALADPATSELVVVVDGADADAERVLADLAAADERVRYLVLEPSVGTARAKLAGARAASAEVLVLLDDDVLPEPRLVSRHLQRHQDQPSLLVVGSMPVDPAPSHSRRDRLAGAIYQRNYETARSAYRRAGTVPGDQLWGGNLSVRRADYLRLTDQLLRYPRLAHEDTHLGLVAERAGLTAVYDEQAAAVHLHHRTWAGMLRESERQGRGQRALHLLHSPALPFPADELPEPLHPVVAPVVLRSDRPAVRRLVLLVLRTATTAALALRREGLAVRFAFAATQVARRAGRRDSGVDAVVAACADDSAVPTPTRTG